MEIKETLAISGMPGLYRMVANKDNGLIVAALGEDKKKFVPSRTHMFTPLENITIYTEDEGVELIQVFLKMKKEADTNPIIKPNSSGNDLRTFFEKVVPNHDTERVYTSDIKKIIKWFSLLDQHGLIVEPVKEKEAKATTEEKKTKKATKTTKKAKA